MNTTPTITRAPITAEEQARRLRLRELRDQIAELARFRTAMNKAFRLPHQSPEWAVAIDAICGLNASRQSVNRMWKREAITKLHIERANLRGKHHVAQ